MMPIIFLFLVFLPGYNEPLKATFVNNQKRDLLQSQQEFDYSSRLLSSNNRFELSRLNLYLLSINI